MTNQCIKISIKQKLVLAAAVGGLLASMGAMAVTTKHATNIQMQQARQCPAECNPSSPSEDKGWTKSMNACRGGPQNNQMYGLYHKGGHQCAGDIY